MYQEYNSSRLPGHIEGRFLLHSIITSTSSRWMLHIGECVWVYVMSLEQHGDKQEIMVYIF